MAPSTSSSSPCAHTSITPESGDIRAGVDPVQLLQAIGDLSRRTPSADGSPNAMVRLLLDGLRLHDGADAAAGSRP